MRIERISDDQFSIFLTYDDLIERGFTKDSLWNDASNVKSLFSDMMYEASSELGIELEGLLFVKVHLMQAQGMHIVVTQELEDQTFNDDYDDFIEMEVTLDESYELIFSFTDFEYIVQVASYLSRLSIRGGQVYYMNEQYYMIINDDNFYDEQREDVIAIMSEFSKPSIISSDYLLEYGKVIYSSNAVKQIINIFYK